MTYVRDLAHFTGEGYDKGRRKIVQVAWLFVDRLGFRRVWLPSKARVWILRAFGASIGTGALIRHDVQIHWPWKLTVGDHTWIGAGAWLLNLEPIRIGSNVCISQSALLCTGSHDRHSPTFEFDNGPIVIGDGSWLAARSTVLRGVTVGRNVVIGATAVVTRDVPDDSVVLAPISTIAASSLRARTNNHAL